jgi:hypothetical protein
MTGQPMPSAAGRACDTQAAQLRYALLIEWGTRLGVLILAGGFAAYVAGWLPAQVPPSALPELWSLPLSDYLSATGSPTGWGWMERLREGDMFALAGIAILCVSPLAALLALVPLYAAARDRAFIVLCLLQSAVLLAAAWGVGA